MAKKMIGYHIPESQTKQKASRMASKRTRIAKAISNLYGAPDAAGTSNLSKGQRVQKAISNMKKIKLR